MESALKPKHPLIPRIFHGSVPDSYSRMSHHKSVPEAVLKDSVTKVSGELEITKEKFTFR